MGRSQRTKGAVGERELVNLLRKAGIPAKRVPLSGAAEGFKGDVEIEPYSLYGLSSGYNPTKLEVKRRRDGFKQIYRWIDDNYALALRADNKGWLVVMRLEDWVEVVR